MVTEQYLSSPGEEGVEMTGRGDKETFWSVKSCFKLDLSGYRAVDNHRTGLNHRDWRIS